jgi:hypothetical protein
MGIKKVIKDIPVVGPAAGKVYGALFASKPGEVKKFDGSEKYWQERYKAGGNSGSGSYAELAAFKAEVINAFVKDNAVKSVIEYGSGDGNQLVAAVYPSFIGFDVSQVAVENCRKQYAKDKTKSFKLVSDYAGETAELTLSLDVIYHLVEDAVFTAYISLLFDSSTRFVILYASNSDNQDTSPRAPHVRHRQFSKWIEANRPGWKLIKHLPNKFPFSHDGKTETGSFADFYIYAKG